MGIKQQSGFAAIETMLVLVIIAIIGGTGWFIWHTKQVTNDSLHEAATSQPAAAKRTGSAAGSKAGVSGWRSFKSKNGVFSVQYPASWVEPVNQKACGDFLKNDLEVGPNASSVITCGGDGTVSQVSITATTVMKGGNAGSEMALRGYTGYTVGKISIDGMSGTTRQAYASGQGEGIGALPDGTKVIVDTVTKGDNVIVAQYMQYPVSQHEGPTSDELTIFQQIVQTIKFN